MADKSPRTRQSGDRNTKAEMNRNREMSFGGALTTRKHGQADAPGRSSSRSRSTKSGAERNQSTMAGRGGSGSSGGASNRIDSERASRPGEGVTPPRKGARKTPIAKKGVKKRGTRSR